MKWRRLCIHKCLIATSDRFNRLWNPVNGLLLPVMVAFFLLLNRLHELVQLANLLVAHLVDLASVQRRISPRVALHRLRVHLPFGEESNLGDW